MSSTKLAIFCSAAALSVISACSVTPVASDSVSSAPGAPIRSSQIGTQYGAVSGIDVLPASARTSGGGAVLGAVLGAVVGRQIGSGSGRDVATGVGAIGGAVVGNQIEKQRNNDSDVFRVSVRLDNGGVAQFDYQRIDDLRVGDRVRVQDGQLHRV